MPGIHCSSDPNSRSNFHASSGLTSTEISALPSAIAASCHDVRAGCTKQAAVPAIGCGDDGARIVLPKPAGEAAARPVPGVDCTQRGAGAPCVREDALEQRGEAQVAAERAVHELRIRT